MVAQKDMVNEIFPLLQQVFRGSYFNIVNANFN